MSLPVTERVTAGAATLPCMRTGVTGGGKRTPALPEPREGKVGRTPEQVRCAGGAKLTFRSEVCGRRGVVPRNGRGSL